MKIINRFSDWLLRTPLLEMAYYRRDGIDKIRSLSDCSIKHIIKYKCIGGVNSDRWKSEIKSYFNRVNGIRIKPKNNKFDADEYMEFLFIEPFCTSDSSYKKNVYKPLKWLDEIINEINIEYSSNIKLTPLIFDKIVYFYKGICNSLSNSDDVNKYIDENL